MGPLSTEFLNYLWIPAGTREMQIGWAYREAGDLVAAKRWFETSLSLMDADEPHKDSPDRAALDLVARAYTLAGLDRKDKAAELVRKVLSLTPRSTDEVIWAVAASGSYPLLDLVGDTQDAMELVRQLLDPPTIATPYEIWFHSFAAPLRANPEFRELMARHGVDVTRDPRAEYAAQQAVTNSSK